MSLRKPSFWAGVTVGLMCTLAAHAALTFSPAAGYDATAIWSGAGGAHFALDGGNVYVSGAENIGGGQYQNVVWRSDGSSTVEIARSPAFPTGAYYPDAITVANGAVYWAHVQSSVAGQAANVYRTAFDGHAWTTTQVLDQSAGLNVYSLSTNGTNVFGVGLGAGGSNVAFYLDSHDDYQVLANIPADATGGSGFDPSGRFFAGAWSVDGDWASHMYAFSAQQIADRLSGAHSMPYTAADAIGDYILTSNTSTVMESDGTRLFGTQYNATWTGTNPMAFDLTTGATKSLGVLSGAATAVCSDLYYRDGAAYFLAKDDWTVGGETHIYRLVPEPASLALLGLLALLRRRGGTR